MGEWAVRVRLAMREHRFGAQAGGWDAHGGLAIRAGELKMVDEVEMADSAAEGVLRADGRLRSVWRGKCTDLVGRAQGRTLLKVSSCAIGGWKELSNWRRWIRRARR